MLNWLIPLILGTGLGMLTTFPLAAWLSGIFLLRASRLLTPGASYLAIVAASTLTAFVTTRGLVPLEVLPSAIMAVSGALLVALVFLADRQLRSKLPDWASLFVLPTGLTFLEFASSAASPFGSWGSMAYSQYGVLPLMQLASITGIWGITFLIALAATVTNLAWERGWRQTRPVLASYVVLLGLVFGYGATRLSLPATGELVRIAGITVPTSTPSGELAERAARAGTDRAAWVAIEADAHSVTERLLDMSLREAEAGARVILWSEANALVTPDGEKSLIARAQAIARTHDAYLGLGFGLIAQHQPLSLENRLVLIGPEGVLWDYAKVKRVPGLETEIVPESSGSIRVAETPLGRVSGAIGFDTDFPPLLYEAGKQKVDLLLSPARDWEGVDPRHTEQAVFRAIEQGFTLVRQARDGWSVVADSRGRVLSALDRRPEAAVMRADVPIARQPSPYTELGDLFPFACMLAFLGLLGSGTILAKQEQEAKLD